MFKIKSNTTLWIVFAVLLIVVSFFMLIKVKDKPIIEKHGFGYWHREFNGYKYTVNLWYTLPMTAMVGLPEPEKLQVIIDINLNLAAGLRGSPVE